MNVIQTLTAISLGITSSFQGMNGVEPYTYAVATGGIGGSIDSNGIYTAPNGVTGVDVIEVTDANLDVATAQIKVLTPHQLVLDIIQNELGLSNDQLILYNQKFNVPNDNRPYVALSIVSTKVLGNNRTYSPDGDKQIQSTVFYDMIQIEIYSKTIFALENREDLVMALKSTYAQSQQEANSFKIGTTPNSFVNLSRQEGSALLYAYALTLTLSYSKRKISNIKYYEEFQNPSILTNS